MSIPACCANPRRATMAGRYLFAITRGQRNALPMIRTSGREPVVSNTNRGGQTVKTYQIKNTDLTVSRLSFGCASLGGWIKGMVDADTVRDAERLVHSACEAGITLFDMADFYGFGNAERAFGEVLKRTPALRDKIVIQSKCGQIMHGDPEPGDPYRVDLSREHIIASVEASLQRLGIDHLDILLLHAPDALMMADEIGEAFAQLKSARKVGNFGVSNFSAAQIERLKRGIDEPLVINQIQLGLGHSHPFVDGMEWAVEVAQDGPDVMSGRKAHFVNAYTSPSAPGIVDYCSLNDIQIQAVSPIRGDLLSPDIAGSAQTRKAAELLGEIAARKGVNPAAIAMAWLLRHPAGIVPVFSSSKPERIAENCKADDVELSRSEWYALFAAAAQLTYRAN
jgi:predicted oxidoreductase